MTLDPDKSKRWLSDHWEDASKVEQALLRKIMSMGANPLITALACRQLALRAMVALLRGSRPEQQAIVIESFKWLDQAVSIEGILSGELAVSDLVPTVPTTAEVPPPVIADDPAIFDMDAWDSSDKEPGS